MVIGCEIGLSKDIAIVGASMVGANACCLAISALPSTANATRREIHPGWLQSSQALFHLGKLATSNSKQYFFPFRSFCRAQHGINLVMLNDRHISRHGHFSLGLPRRLPGERGNTALEVSLPDLSSAFNPSWDLGWFQVLDLPVENFGGTSNGFSPRPTQWFFPIAVWEGDALETVQGVHGWTSTSAGAHRLPYEFLTLRESEGDSFQTERCGVPIQRAMFSR